MTDSAMKTATAIFSPCDSLGAAMDDYSLRAEWVRPAHAIRRFADNMSHAKGNEAEPGEIHPDGSGRVRPIGRTRSIRSIVSTCRNGVKPTSASKQVGQALSLTIQTCQAESLTYLRG